MGAAIVALGAFFVFAVIGAGIIAATRREAHGNVDLRTALLAPTFGLAFLTVVGISLNRAGLPVGVFALPLVITGCAATVVLFALRRPRFPWASLAAFVPILALAFALTANPVFKLGFDWLGYANDDGANYSLGASRMLRGGFSTAPDTASLLEQRDAAQHLYFFHVITKERFGADLDLALIAGSTGREPVVVLMPFLIALLLVFVCSTSALLANRGLVPACLAGIAIAVAALPTYSTVAEVLAQCVGLPLLVCSVAVLFDPELYDAQPRKRAGRLVLGGLTLSALAMTYPELGVFFVVPLGAALGIGYFRRAVELRTAARSILVLAALAVLVVNVGLAWVAQVLTSRVTSGSGANTELFDFSRMPSMFPMAMGSIPVFYVAEPYMSIAIVAGAIALAAIVAFAVVEAKRAEPVALVFLTFVAVTTVLFFRGLDFDVFKSGLYVQPFLWCLVILAGYRVAELTRGRRYGGLAAAIGYGLVLVPSAFNIPTQRIYVYASLPNVSDAGIVAGTPARFITQLAGLVRATGEPDVISDSANPTVIKYEAIFARGHAFDVPGWDVLHNLDLPHGVDTQPVQGPYAEGGYAAAYARLHPLRAFDLHPTDPHAPARLTFVADDVLHGVAANRIAMWESAPTMQVINRSGEPIGDRELSVVPLSSARNHLLIVANDLTDLTPWADERVGGSLPLADGTAEGETTTQGVGRYELFQVLNPSPTLRFILSISTTLNDVSNQPIPPAVVIGAQRYPLRAVGSGSARLVSPQIVPQYIDGNAYVALDMGRPATLRHIPKSPVMASFNAALPIDGRLTVGEVRDMSVVDGRSADTALAAYFDDPRALVYDEPIPYSGMYENGAVAESATYALRLGPHDREMLVAYRYPVGVAKARITVAVDGKAVLAESRGAGSHLAIRTVALAPGVHRIDVRIDGPLVFERIAGGRWINGYVMGLGFINPAARPLPSFDIYDMRQPLSLLTGWYDLERLGGSRAFGRPMRWVDNDATIEVGPSRAADELQVDAEPGPGMAGRPLVLHAREGTSELGTATFLGAAEASFDVPAHARPIVLTLRADGGGARIPDDPRTLNFRVTKLRLVRRGGGPS